MHKLLRLLQTPYPVFYQRGKVALISSFIVFLILMLLQPFGISGIKSYKYCILAGYMTVTAMFICIPLYLLPMFFPRYYAEEKWNIGKYIVNNFLIFIFIAIGNWLYSAWLFGGGLRMDLLVSFLFCTVVVGLFPVVFFALLSKNKLLALHLKEAMEMNNSLQKKQNSFEGEQIRDMGKVFCILFQGGSKEILEVNARDVLFVEAEGNYIKINYQKDGKLSQKLLRATMKQAEEAVTDCPFIVKCHRAFLVNAGAVSKVIGNSQGYRLSMVGTNEEIPVSRAYSKDVKSLIESMNGG